MAKPHYQCKLCNLIKQDKELWIVVHNKVLKDNISKTVVCKWLNETVKVKNSSRPDGSKIPTFNNANFTKHFQSHINDIEKLKLEMSKFFSSSNERGSTSFNDEELSTMDVHGGNNIDDEYEFLSIALKDMEDKFVEYNRNMKGKRNFTSLKEIEQMQKVISNIIDSRNNLIKLKNSNNVMSMAMQAAIERVVTSMLESMMDVTEEVRLMLIKEINNEKLVESAVGSIRNRVGNDAKLIISEVLLKITKEFNFR